jgi:hypothetical protein
LRPQALAARRCQNGPGPWLSCWQRSWVFTGSGYNLASIGGSKIFLWTVKIAHAAQPKRVPAIAPSQTQICPFSGEATRGSANSVADAAAAKEYRYA